MAQTLTDAQMAAALQQQNSSQSNGTMTDAQMAAALQQQGQNTTPNPVAQAYQQNQQVGQIPVNPGMGYGMNTMNAINANSMLGPDANESAIKMNLELQKNRLNIANQAMAANAIKNATIPGDIIEKVKQAELVGGQAQAKDQSIIGMLSQMMEKRNEDYATAYDGHLAGGHLQTMLGDAFGLKPIIGGATLPYPSKSLEAAASFDAANNAMISRGQQIFGEQVGTGAASTRIMSTVVDLLKGEYGTRADSPESMIGRSQGTIRSIYIMNKATKQYLKNLGDIDKKFTTPEELDQLSQGLVNAFQKSQNSLTKEDEANIKALQDEVTSPLQRLVPNNNNKNDNNDNNDNNQMRTPSGLLFSYKLSPGNRGLNAKLSTNNK